MSLINTPNELFLAFFEQLHHATEITSFLLSLGERRLTELLSAYANFFKRLFNKRQDAKLGLVMAAAHGNHTLVRFLLETCLGVFGGDQLRAICRSAGRHPSCFLLVHTNAQAAMTGLIWAVASNDRTLLGFLLENGPTLLITDEDSIPVHEAGHRLSGEVLDRVMRSGYNLRVSMLDESGSWYRNARALWWMRFYGDVWMVFYLLELKRELSI